MSTSRPGSEPSRTEILLAAARVQDQHAWTEIYERYKRMALVAVELKIPGHLRRRFDAEDVLQEAFSKAWSKLDSFQYDGPGSFRAWLKRIVTREFYNLLDAQAAPANSAQGDGEGGQSLSKVLSGARHPSELVQELEAHAELLEKMGELDEVDQDLISMRLFEHMDWSDIGEVMGLHRTTASEQFRAAIARLSRRIS